MPALNLNLLPADLAPKESIVKLANTIKRLAFIGFSLFLVAGLASGAFLLYLSGEITALESKQEQYKQSIRALEQTEQRLVLLRDRVNKAERILKTTPVEKKIEAFDNLISGFPTGITFSSVDIQSDKIDLTMMAKDSLALKLGMAQLLESNQFKRIEMTSFGLSPKSGYVVNLHLYN